MKITCLPLLILIVFISCKGPSDSTQSSGEKVPVKKQRPLSYQHGKFMEIEGRKLLYGGEDSTWHFDITNSTLKDEQYHYGIGREAFKALIHPEFIDLAEADAIYPDSARFLLLDIEGDVRAYGIDLLTQHEVVNDVVGGQPVMAAYCILADLGAIYDRTYGDKELTFALSGYTYFDSTVWDGLDGFILWDRETESTWWPLIGKAVSGGLMDTKLKVYQNEQWSQTTWGEIKKSYSAIKVLKPEQTMEPPLNWPKFTKEEVEEVKVADTDKSVAPKWGENG